MATNDQNNLAELDSVSKRLKYIVDTLGVKQSHMAEKLGVSPSGLHYILNNDVKFSKNAKKIAEYLKVNEQWLATGKGDIYEENTSIKTYKIPVFYPDQLKLQWTSDHKKELSTNNSLITTTAYENNMIAIYSTEQYFNQKFEPGDIIAFEQSPSFNDGEILLVYLKKTNDIALFYGFHLESSVILASTNKKPLRLDKDDVIIGNYRECLKKAQP